LIIIILYNIYIKIILGRRP